MFIRNKVLFSLLKPHTSSNHYSSSSTLHPPSSTHSTTADATKATIKEELKQAGGWFTTLAKSKANIIIGGTVGLLGLNFIITKGASWWYTRQVGSSLSHGILPPPSSTASSTTGIASTPPPSASTSRVSSSDKQQQVRDYYRRSLVDRPELHTQIKDILNPKTPTRFFHIITGRRGTGKTTAVLRCCRDLKEGRGMGYINVDPVSRDFGKDLGETFNFRMEEHLTIFNVISQITLGSKVAETPKKDPLSTLRRAAGALHDAAAAFKNMTGEPFILVIDSTDRLLHSSNSSGNGSSSSSDNSQVLTALLQYAEQWAEEGVVICVFIVSDEETMEKLSGSNPLSSRVAHPPLMVRDLTRTQAITLLSHYGISDDIDDDSNTKMMMMKKKKSNATTTTPSLAGKCLDLSGGSLLLLERCAGIINALKTNTGTTDDEVIGHHVETNMMSLVRGAYKAAGLLDATPHQLAGLSVIKELLELPAPIFDNDNDDTTNNNKKKKNGLAASKWRELIPNVDHQKKLLREGGGVLEFDGERVRFSSRLARVYAERELRGVVSKEAAEKLDGGKKKKKKKEWWVIGK
jgi:hypothetical protein